MTAEEADEFFDDIPNFGDDAVGDMARAHRELQARCRELEALCYRAQSLLATAEDPLPAWNAERDRWLADWTAARVGLG